MASTIFCYPGSHCIVDGKEIKANSIKAAIKLTSPKEEAKVEAPKQEAKAEAKPKAG